MSRPKGSKNKPSDVIEGIPPMEGSEVAPQGPLSIRHWLDYGISCEYVQFSLKPVAPQTNKEPVWELKLDTKDVRYKVDFISYFQHGLVFSVGDQLRLVPLSNVAYVRPI